MIVPTLMIIIYYNDLTCNDFDDCMINMISGWWFQPLWKILVSWDDDIPNIWTNQIHVPNHQPDSCFLTKSKFFAEHYDVAG